MNISKKKFVQTDFLFIFTKISAIKLINKMSQFPLEFKKMCSPRAQKIFLL